MLLPSRFHKHLLQTGLRTGHIHTKTSVRPRLLVGQSLLRFSSSQNPKEEARQQKQDVKIEIDEAYKAHQNMVDQMENAFRDGFGTERKYQFEHKRLTITNYKSAKSDKISTVQIDGKDKSVKFLATEKSRLSLHELKLRTLQVISETYLPKDFPDSVSKEFLPFTIYSLISGVATGAMLFLSTQSLFVALGGSSTQSQLAAAAYTWVLKDGIGQLGGIVFASRYGGYFDEDIKKWRFFAMSTLNLSILIEIMTLKFPHLFLLLASTANMGKNICFLMAAASRAQINMRFAKRNNIADIAGKSVSMFTTSSLLGMGVGMGFSKIVDISSLSQLAPVFAFLTFVNLYSTYSSANLIDEVYLNNQRSKILFDQFLLRENTTKQIPSMREVNALSNFTVPNFLNWHHCRFIRFGENSISHVIGQSKNYYVTSLMHQLHKENRNFVYYIQMLPKRSLPFKAVTNNGRPFVIHLNMKKEASNIDQLAAYYLARLLDLELKQLFEGPKSEVNFEKIQNCMRLAELKFSLVDMQSFVADLVKQEWSLDYIYLDSKQNLYDFKLEHVKSAQQPPTEDKK